MDPERTPLDDITRQAWAIVLAGGDGLRLQPLIRDVFGDDRPKQYAPLVAAESLLRQTLGRIAPLIPPGRTAVVSQERHAPYLARELASGHGIKLLLQPENRDTAAGIFLPAYWVAGRDPEATVVVLPSDHFVLEETAFVAHLAEVISFVEGHPEWLVLLGARATAPEREYGWIEPGDPLGATSAGAIARVSRFREKPSLTVAAACLARGWLWNTFVFVAKARMLLSLADVLLPDLHRGLGALVPFFDTRKEQRVLREVYARLPRHNFSQAVLQAGLPFLAVSTLPPLAWSDLGTPRRLFTLLRTLKFAPAWMRGRAGHGHVSRSRVS